MTGDWLYNKHALKTIQYRLYKKVIKSNNNVPIYSKEYLYNREEVKRHNQALEKLAKAKEKCYESEVKRTNDEAGRRAEILDANKDIDETNRALEDLRDFTKLMNDSASQR